MKLIFSFLIFLAIVLFAGFKFSNFFKKQKFYKNLKEFLEVLQTEIGFFKNDLTSIFEKMKFNHDFSKMLEHFKQHKNLESWNLEFLSQSEQQDIKAFFLKLGRSDVETQTAEIQSFLKLLETKLEDLKVVELKKSKTNFSLTILLGLFVFVLLI